MKKLLSILMIITVLLATLVIAVPASASTQWTKVEMPETEIDHTDWTPISTEEEFLAMKSTSYNPGKYYLTQDIVITNPKPILNTPLATDPDVTQAGEDRESMPGGGQELCCLTLDGNGYSVTWGTEEKPARASMFAYAYNNNMTITNIAIDGYIEWKNVDRGEGAVAYIGGLISKTDLYTTTPRENHILIENCVFDIDQKVETVQFEGHVGGIIGSTCHFDKNEHNKGVNSVIFRNVVNKGDIIANLATANIHGSSSPASVGGFVAQLGESGGATENTVLFENCSYEGNIEVICGAGAPCVGGFVGRSTGKFGATYKNCTMSGSITGSNMTVGGIAGSIVTGTFENCANIGASITDDGLAPQYVGGIVGAIAAKGTRLSSLVSINNCYNLMNIDSFCEAAGGILGYAAINTEREIKEGDEVVDTESLNASISITDCINLGNISTDGYAGGIAGSITFKGESPLASFEISNCVNGGGFATEEEEFSGIASLDSDGAGIIANLGSFTSDEAATITNCASSGIVSGLDRAAAILAYTESSVTIENCVSYSELDAGETHSITLAENAEMNEVYAWEDVVYDDSDGVEIVSFEEVAAVVENLELYGYGLSLISTMITMEEYTEEDDYTPESWAAYTEALDEITADFEEFKEKNPFERYQYEIDELYVSLEGLNELLVELEAESTGPAATEAPTATETEAPEEEGGCGSVIGAGAVVLGAVLTLGAGVVLKKKEN